MLRFFKFAFNFVKMLCFQCFEFIILGTGSGFGDGLVFIVYLVAVFMPLLWFNAINVMQFKSLGVFTFGWTPFYLRKRKWFSIKKIIFEFQNLKYFEAKIKDIRPKRLIFRDDNSEIMMIFLRPTCRIDDHSPIKFYWFYPKCISSHARQSKFHSSNVLLRPKFFLLPWKKGNWLKALSCYPNSESFLN